MLTPAQVRELIRLRAVAESRGLSDSPPYDDREAQVWKAGYDTALQDLAAGKLNSLSAA